MRVLLVYDRANKWGGAERFLLAIKTIFPNSDLATSVHYQKSALWSNIFNNIRTSFLQTIPFFRSRHELIPYLMPLAFESLTVSDYDLVISITSEYAKGVITPPGIRHVCICLTPPRYLWHDYHTYMRPFLLRIATFPILKYLRLWDRIAAYRPDKLLAISKEVQSRITTFYKRESSVLYPPISTNYWMKIDKQKVQLPFKDYYLVVSRLVPYKRIDLAIAVCKRTKKNLVIVGTGSEEEKLRKMSDCNICFVSHLSDQELSYMYTHARALIHPQLEDFGLTVLEAQTFGVPVIAYAHGGVVETIKDGVTGILFAHQSEDSLLQAFDTFENMKFNKEVIMKNAKRFDIAHFKKKFLAEIRNTIG